jgi:hypothetical protein
MTQQIPLTISIAAVLLASICAPLAVSASPPVPPDNTPPRPPLYSCDMPNHCSKDNAFVNGYIDGRTPQSDPLSLCPPIGFNETFCQSYLKAYNFASTLTLCQGQSPCDICPSPMPQNVTDLCRALSANNITMYGGSKNIPLNTTQNVIHPCGDVQCDTSGFPLPGSEIMPPGVCSDNSTNCGQ